MKLKSKVKITHFSGNLLRLSGVKGYKIKLKFVGEEDILFSILKKRGKYDKKRK